MSIITRCDGCGKTWRERLGEKAPQPGSHNHINYGLLAMILFPIAFTLFIAAVVLARGVLAR